MGVMGRCACSCVCRAVVGECLDAVQRDEGCLLMHVPGVQPVGSTAPIGVPWLGGVAASSCLNLDRPALFYSYISLASGECATQNVGDSA